MPNALASKRMIDLCPIKLQKHVQVLTVTLCSDIPKVQMRYFRPIFSHVPCDPLAELFCLPLCLKQCFLTA